MTGSPSTAHRDDVAPADRLRGLLDAYRTITDDISPTSVLDRIVRAACELIGAEYGALVVSAADGSIEHVVHQGLDATAAARVDPDPTRRGAARTAVLDPDIVHLGDRAADGRPVAFPGRPPVQSFIGVPIRVRAATIGELYLGDRRPGRFDADDEELVLALAATAGNAIHNARLYEEARRSRDWLTAAADIARALLARSDDDVAGDIVAEAARVAEADYACLILPTPDGRLQVTAATGPGADHARGLIFEPSHSTLGRAVLAARSNRTHDIALWTGADFQNPNDYGPALLAPLLDGQGSRGAVLILRAAGRTHFLPQDVEHASTFAAQVAVALELDETRAEVEWVRVLEDRHKVAQDLHDNVMQRLFATGVGLQAIADQRLDPDITARLARHIADLDETIDEIRSRAFGLQAVPERVCGAPDSAPAHDVVI